MVKSSGTVAITGASGFIGKHLVEQLKHFRDHRIRVLSRNQQPNSRETDFGPSVEVIHGDLEVSNSLHGFLDSGCTVVHLAYLQGRRESENLVATANLLAACKAAKVKRLIHCSTSAVFGRAPGCLITEDTPCNPVSEYGITKLRIEEAVLAAASDGFDVVILRPTAVFGAGSGSLAKLAADLLARKTLQNYLKSCLFNERRMNLVYVANVVAAIVFMIQCEANFEREIYIVSDDDSQKNNYLDVERYLMHQFALKGYSFPILPLPLALLKFLLHLMGRNDTNPQCNFDSRKLLSLGFKRPVEFEAGLNHYAGWYRSHQ